MYGTVDSIWAVIYINFATMDEVFRNAFPYKDLAELNAQTLHDHDRMRYNGDFIVREYKAVIE